LIATILNPAPSIIFNIAPELPAPKASGLIMVKVLLPAIVIIFVGLNMAAKIHEFVESPNNGCKIYIF
jgi:hypothetical protein